MFSETGGGATSAVIILALKVSYLDNMKYFVYYAAFLSFEIAVISVPKMLYAEDRPYWNDTRLAGNEENCSKEFGNPSGHTILAVGIATLACTDMWRALNAKRIRGGLSLGAFIAILVVTVPLSIFYVYAMAASRVITGAHATNQVVYAVFLGFWAAFSFILIVREPLFAEVEYLQSISISKDAGETETRELKEKRNSVLIKRWVIGTLAFVVLALLQLGAYWISKPYATISDLTLANIRYQCEEPELTRDDLGNNVSLKQVGLSIVGYGAYAGLLIQVGCFGTYSEMAQPEKYWFAKGLGRLGVLIPIMIIPLFLLVALPFKNPTMNMLFKKGVPTWLLLAAIGGFFDVLCFKWGLWDNKENQKDAGLREKEAKEKGELELKQDVGHSMQ